MRARGAGWVVAQFALMAAIAGAWLLPPDWPGPIDRPLDVGGLVLAVAGIVLGATAGRALGAALTPFPRPRAGAGLVTAGPYRLARHPMYGGGLLLLGGLSLVWSVPSLLLSMALGVLWWRKSVAEERWLAARYAGYVAYRRRTPRRFLPFIA